MTDREIMQQALDFVEFVWRDVSLNEYAEEKRLHIEKILEDTLARPDTDWEAVAADQAMTIALWQSDSVTHPIIAGALFDFMGWLTSRKERIVLSSADNASPAVDVITEFAKMRGLSLNDAKVQDWNIPPQRQPLTEEQMRECAQAMDAEPLAEGWSELIKFARAIEKAHGIVS